MRCMSKSVQPCDFKHIRVINVYNSIRFAQSSQKNETAERKEEREKEREQKVIIDGLTHFFSHFWIDGRRILLARRLHKIDSILCIHKCIIL